MTFTENPLYKELNSAGKTKYTRYHNNRNFYEEYVYSYAVMNTGSKRTRDKVAKYKEYRVCATRIELFSTKIQAPIEDWAEEVLSNGLSCQEEVEKTYSEFRELRNNLHNSLTKLAHAENTSSSSSGSVLSVENSLAEVEKSRKSLDEFVIILLSTLDKYAFKKDFL